MADNYKITQYSVNTILGYVENSQIAIPEIQRPFVWKGQEVKILIDGQQRVTALMAALLGREVLDSQYRSHRIKIAFYPLAQPGEEKFAVSDASYEEKPGWIPDISVLFRRDFSFRKFEREYKEKNPDVDAAPLEAALRQYERFGFRISARSENHDRRVDGGAVVKIKMERSFERPRAGRGGRGASTPEFRAAGAKRLESSGCADCRSPSVLIQVT